MIRHAIDSVLLAVIFAMCGAAQEPHYHLISNFIANAQQVRAEIATTANTFNTVAGAL
ncbi:MAG TPA: hypothetical protein VGG51_07855 [Candidatus Cybelea sp.]